MEDDLRNLFNNANNMDGEEFKKEFIKIMNQRQKDMENFMKSIYGFGSGNTFNPFNSMRGGFNLFGMPNDDLFGKKPNKENDMNSFLFGRNDDLINMFNKMFNNMGTDFDNDEWDSKSWTSPDGSMSFYSSSRTFDPDDIDTNIDNYFNSEKKENPLDVLKKKMAIAIEKQNYEEAANYRDAIKAIEEKEDTNESEGE